MSASPEQREHAMERVKKIYAVLKRTAEIGDVCPTNKVLAARFGCGTTKIVNAIHFLESAGMIDVERMNCSRIVTICATGLKTAGSSGKPHWTLAA